MTNSDVDTSGGTLDPAEPAAQGSDFLRPDIALQTLADIANSGAGISVTLYLPFGAVTGTTTSGDRHFAGLASNLRKTDHDTKTERGKTVELFANNWDWWAENVKAPRSDEPEDIHPADVFYIHLEDVHCIGAGNAVFTHDYLRVRLSQVTAWTQGAPSLAGSDD